jgi:hypothetical protein
MKVLAKAPWLYDNRFRIQRLLTRLAGGRTILIFGPGGMGKTCLARLLDGSIHLPAGLASDRSVGAVSLGTGSRHIRVEYLPGQERFWLNEQLAEIKLQGDWLAASQKIARGKHRMLVHVVAAGCWHPRDQPVDGHRAWQSAGCQKAQDFIQPWRHHGLDLELFSLAALSDAIVASPEPLSLLTVVTGQDLWWSERNEVRKYYSEQGAARDHIPSVASVRPAAAHSLGEPRESYATLVAQLRRRREGLGRSFVHGIVQTALLNSEPLRGRLQGGEDLILRDCDPKFTAQSFSDGLDALRNELKTLANVRFPGLRLPSDVAEEVRAGHAAS